MGLYKTILLAVDLHEHYDEHTTKRAVEFAKLCGGNLYVLHVVEGIHAYGAAQGYEIIIDVEKQLEEEASRSLAQLCAQFNIAPEKQMIMKGFPKVAIIEQAKKLNADLIVVGLHSRHGMNLLFGSTTDGVTHHAPCDVLEIKAHEKG